MERVPHDVSTPPPAPPRLRRVVVAGVATDGGATAVEIDDLLVRRARALRDAGVEVVWAGSGLRVEQVAAIAVSEDADGVEVAPTGAAADVSEALTRLEADDVEVAAADR